jgi:hypothetical protein
MASEDADPPGDVTQADAASVTPPISYARTGGASRGLPVCDRRNVVFINTARTP